MTSNRNTIIRSMHDLGAAAWFGGTLMGAIGLNGASKDVKDPAERATIAAAGWTRWAPISTAAIGAHLVGATGLLLANRDRVRDQRGAGANTVIKTVLTAAAIGTTAYSGMLGAKIATEAGPAPVEEGTVPSAGAAPVEGGTVPSEGTPDKVAKLLQQQRVLQWVTPALTGGILILGAQQGEQQRASEQIRTRDWSRVIKSAVDRVPKLMAS